MSVPPRLRADLAAVAGYRPGQRASHETLPSYSLASNEMPFGPLPGVAEAVAEAAATVHRYPDPAATALTGALSERLGVGTDELTLGTGSVAVCQQAVVATSGRDDEVVYPWRSFEAYPIITRLAGATSVPVPLLPDGRHDLAAMAAAVTDRTRLVFVCTPNNPTGPAVGKAELERFLDAVPQDVLVAIDEAYFEFGLDDDSDEDLDGIALSRGRPNVLVIRTFSKAYGLAALRVGYGVASPVVAAALRKTAVPFGVSAPAQAAALASLDQQEALRRRVGETCRERARVVAAARALGHPVPDTAGNFYWLPLGHAAERFAHACKDHGVTVRAFAGEGVRVTVGEPAANDIVLAVLAESQVEGSSTSAPVG